MPHLPKHEYSCASAVFGDEERTTHQKVREKSARVEVNHAGKSRCETRKDDSRTAFMADLNLLDADLHQNIRFAGLH
jgi:hypothetical protein